MDVIVPCISADGWPKVSRKFWEMMTLPKTPFIVEDVVSYQL
jgi:hypothetical protein